MIDYTIFQAINQFAGNKPTLDFLMVTMTDFGIPILFTIMLFFANKKTTYKTLFAAGIVFVIDFLFKIVYFRQRPFVTHDVNLLVDHLQSASFPSRHTDIAFAFAQSIFLGDKKTGVAALIIAAIVGLSRVYVGVHYPLDVLAGAVLGIAGAYFSSFLIDQFWKGE